MFMLICLKVGVVLAPMLGRGAIVACVLAGFALMAIAYGMVFSRAGVPAWRAFVPGLSAWERFRLMGTPPAALAAYLMAVGVNALVTLGVVSLPSAVGDVTMVATAFSYYLFCFDAAKSFGQLMSVSVGILLLEPLFVAYLVLKSGYRGPAQPDSPHQPFNLERFMPKGHEQDDLYEFAAEQRQESERIRQEYYARAAVEGSDGQDDGAAEPGDRGVNAVAPGDQCGVAAAPGDQALVAEHFAGEQSPARHDGGAVENLAPDEDAIMAAIARSYEGRVNIPGMTEPPTRGPEEGEE